MSDDKNTKELTEQEIVDTLDKESGKTSSTKTKEAKKTKSVKKKSKVKGLKSEFKRISWPSRKETAGSTVAVIVVSIIMCIIIAIVDYLIQNGLTLTVFRA